MSTYGTVWWNELRTPDNRGAINFYTRLMGWQVFQIGPEPGKPCEDGNAAYTVWMAGWKQVGGMLSGMVHKDGEPLGWVPFLAVENVDECARRAVELGGEIVEDPFDVPNSGRFALLRDPQGALFGVAKPLGTDD